jgi:hypothetical protein
VESNRECNQELCERSHWRTSQSVHIVSDIYANKSVDTDSVSSDGEQASGHTMADRGPSSERESVDGDVRGYRPSKLLVLLDMAHRALLLLSKPSEVSLIAKFRLEPKKRTIKSGLERIAARLVTWVSIIFTQLCCL